MFPLLWLSTAFLFGLVLNGTFHSSWIPWAGGVVFSAGIILLERCCSKRWPIFHRLRSRLPLPAGVILCAFFLGGLRFPAPQVKFQPTDLAFYNKRAVSVEGVICTAPDRGSNSQRFLLQVENLVNENGTSLPVRGRLQVQTLPAGDWQYGDRLSLTGYLNPAAESTSSSYRGYLERQGITSLLYYPRIDLLARGAGNPITALLFKLRDHAYRTAMRIFPQPEGALYAGILLGMEDELPDTLVKAYQATGTAHIFAISGFNIAIVAGVFTAVFRRWFVRWQAALLAMASIAFFTLMVGATPSVLRAAIMGSLGIVAQLIGRRSASLTTLAFTAALMCAFNPHLPWDVSFQLSFMATLGLMLFASPMENGLEGWLARRIPAEKVRAWSRPIIEYFLLTLAAQAMTLPVLAYHFHRLSLSGLIANPLELPAQPLAMILGGLAVIVGMIFLPLGRLLAWLAWPIAAYTNRIVVWLAGFPGNFTLGSVSVWTVLGLYLLAFLFIGLARKWKQAVAQGTVLAAVSLVTVLVWRAVLTAPDGRLHVTVLGLQDSSAFFIQTPGGNNILVNASAASEDLGAALDARLSLFDRRLDAVIVSLPSTASLNGLNALMANLPVRQVVWTCATDSRAAERVVATLLQQDGSQDLMEQGDALQLDTAVVFSAPVKTEAGSALLISYQDLSILIPSGVSLRALEQAVPESTRQAGILILTDADLGSTTPAEWESLHALVIWAEPLIPTPREGWVSLYRQEWITLASDGQGVWLSER